jgi:Spy/CpxP family protein refolding chaperone
VVTRWWAVAGLALSIGLNAGLLVAVLQQRWLTPPVVTVSLPADDAEPAVDGWSLSRPIDAAQTETAPSGPGGSDDPGPGGAGESGGVGGAAGATPPAGRTGGVSPPAEPATNGILAYAEPAAPPGQRSDAPPEPPAAGDVEPPFGGGPSPERLDEMMERLGVPPADRPQFLALHRRFFSASHEQRVRLESVRREMRVELTSPQPDRSRIDRLVVQSAELQVGIERTFVDHVLEARELLDGEAERRYLHLLSRLGRGGGPGGGRGPAGAAPPPWERPRGGMDRGRRQGGRGPGGFGGPAAPAPSQRPPG